MTDTIDLLVLGGTSWLGGTVAGLARDRGHRVTCLARGESGAVPSGTRWVRADRREPDAYAAVAGSTWDAVLDVSWQPTQVRSALTALAGQARHWISVSSVSVYQEGGAPGVLHEPWVVPGDGTGEAGLEVYGPAKVSCELLSRQALAAEALLIARAGLIVGYGDRSDRFGYWPARFAVVSSPGEQVLVPPLRHPLQVIDVADLADWLVTAAERRIAGTFDAVGDPSTIGRVLGACAAAAEADPVCVEPDQDWLLSRGVAAWSGPGSLPLWLPLPENAGMMTLDSSPAKAAGLTLRPALETAVSALAWEVERGVERERRAGLSRRRERELLDELRSGSISSIYRQNYLSTWTESSSAGP